MKLVSLKAKKHGHETGFSEGEKYGIELNSIETAGRMLQLRGVLT